MLWFQRNRWNYLEISEMVNRSGEMEAAQEAYRQALDLTENEVEHRHVNAKIEVLREDTSELHYIGGLMSKTKDDAQPSPGAPSKDMAPLFIGLYKKGPIWTSESPSIRRASFDDNNHPKRAKSTISSKSPVAKPMAWSAPP